MKKKINSKSILTKIGFCLFVLIHVAVVWLSFHPELCLNPELVEQLFFVGAQIIAGLYGTTLTGYVFLMGRIDEQIANNPTKEDVIISLEYKYKNMIYLISADMLFSFIGIGASIFYRSGIITIPDWAYYIILNETLVFMCFVILFILYFINRVIDPKRLEQAAIELKTVLERKNTEPGNTTEFIISYSKLEKECRNQIPLEIKEHLKKNGMENSILIHKYIRQQNLYSQQICDNLECLRKYHSCLLYGEKLTVTKSMCQLAQNTLSEMEKPKAK